MAKLTIENLFHRELEVSDLSKSLLHHLHSHGVDWMHACGAKGRCTTCKAIVVSGLQHLNAPTAPELRYRQEGLLRENERLACQATLQGDVCIRVSRERDWYQWAWSGKTPNTMEVPVYLVWVE